MKKNRREFLKYAGLGGLAISTTGVNSRTFTDRVGDGTMKDELLFLNPIDGDMLSEYDGIVSNECLTTKVKVMASAGRTLKLNGIGAKFTDGIYWAEVCLKDYKNVIEVFDVNSGERQSITAFWLKNLVNKYRLSLDDNIWFLQDISENSNKYKSIFENPYLGFLKQVHDTYGTKIHLNIYYQTEGFNLSQMTTKFKSEWRDNSGWLGLSFHALQNDPDRPYIKASYDQVKKDCEMVNEQIRRFAGEEVTGPVTTLHWGAATVEGCRALRDAGYTALAGYFIMDDPDPVSYYLDIEKRQHVNNRFIWRDNKEGLIFARMALVINLLEQDDIVPYLDNLRSDGHKPAYVDLMIHEQYYYPFYKDYQPDYKQKVLTSVKWAAVNGYKPAFLSECVFG